MKYKRYRRGVFCVVYRLKPLRYLILHRKFHWKGWEFTKGGKKPGEILKQTCRREVKEETGLRIIKINKFSIKGKFLYGKSAQEERKAQGFIYTLFACEVKKTKVRISKKEHDKYKWHSYSEAMKLLKWPNQRKGLRTVNQKLKKLKN